MYVDASLLTMVLPKIKQARKTNFSSLETSMLLEEYTAERDFLQSCFSTEVTNKRKRAAWEVVKNRVSASGVAYRTVDELKEKYGGHQHRSITKYCHWRIVCNASVICFTNFIL